MALCITDMFTKLPGTQPAAMQPLVADLWVLADRIARNREIAGLHYPSDTAGGIALAQGMLPYLQGMGAGSAYATAVAAAVLEWTWP